MKKLMRKLVLSCFALGLAVVTLTTTTFAWYTSNVDVTAKEVTGTTATSGDALLMITQTWNTEKTALIGWDTKIDDVVETGNPNIMKPLAYNSTSHAFATLNKESATASDAADEGWLQFTLYFKVASDKDDLSLYLSSMVFTNDTKVNGVSALPTKDILAGGHAPLAANPTDTVYSIDVLRTLLVEIQATRYVQTTEGGNAAKDGDTTYALYNPEALMEFMDDSWVDPVADDTSTDNVNEAKAGSNAHEYYNAIMDGTNIATTEQLYGAKNLQTSSGSGTALKIVDLPNAGKAATAGSYVEVTFRVFINGWDLACFDAVQGQTFSIDLAFTTVSTDALKYAD